MHTLADKFAKMNACCITKSLHLVDAINSRLKVIECTCMCSICT